MGKGTELRSYEKADVDATGFRYLTVLLVSVEAKQTLEKEEEEEEEGEACGRWVEM